MLPSNLELLNVTSMSCLEVRSHLSSHATKRAITKSSVKRPKVISMVSHFLSVTMEFALETLIAALLCAFAHATSYPALSCVNEQAKRGDCHTEVKEVVQAMALWFDPYVKSNKAEDDGGTGRHLVDCTRFCDPLITYFNVHAPCDCESWRRLSSTESLQQATEGDHFHHRNLLDDLSPLEGPIQIFENFASKITDARCKEIFFGSKCVVTFLTHYSNEIRVEEPVEPEDDEDEDLKNSLVDSPKLIRYDPSTGEVVEEGELSDEEMADASSMGTHFNPITGKPINPVTGEDIDGPDDPVPDQEFVDEGMENGP
jgi:hypothetical protein